jgi:hypothetical protein
VATEHDNDEVCVPTVLVFDGFYTEHYRSVLQTAGCADPRRRRRRGPDLGRLPRGAQQLGRIGGYDRPELWVRRVVANHSVPRFIG